jgi:hypothetical protein
MLASDGPSEHPCILFYVEDNKCVLVGYEHIPRRPDRAVVDAGRCFDIDNLFIFDNSVFPSALAANPALTIMALPLRTADCFLTTRG